MDFSLGIELQTSQPFCSNIRFQSSIIQKKGVFFIYTTSGTKLFRIEIDGKDLEFVTQPFFNYQNQLFQETLKQLNIVANLLISRPKNFQIWRAEIDKQADIKMEIDKNIFDKVKDITFTYPDQEKFLISFKPQITIGCSLKNLVPLYCGFFGFVTTSKPMSKFSSSLPFFDRIKALAESDSSDEMFRISINDFIYKDIIGLIYLHALTLVGLTPILIGDQIQTAIKQILSTYEDCSKLNWQSLQIDAKQNLLWMSRRPFSEMFFNAKKSWNKSNFILLYKQSIVKLNQRFSNVLNVPEKCEYANYGDEYKQNDDAINLDYIAFKEDFWKAIKNDKEKLKEKLLELLKHGILTTPMIRNFMIQHEEKVPSGKTIVINNYLNCNEFSKINSIFSSGMQLYFDCAISSICKTQEEWQEGIRKVFNPYNKTIDIFKYNEDSLSPPWFLPDNDAMGWYKDTNLNPEFPKDWSLVETRGIDKFSKYYRNKTEIKDPLYTPLSELKNLNSDGLKLFNFLANLNLNDIINNLRIFLKG